MPEKAAAAVMVGPNTMETREIDIPAIGEDDALLRVEAAGVCGTDYEWFQGDLPVPYPLILGHEPLGLIEAIGPVASRRWGVEAGDRVAVRSAYRCGRCAACLPRATRDALHSDPRSAPGSRSPATPTSTPVSAPRARAPRGTEGPRRLSAL